VIDGDDYNAVPSVQALAPFLPEWLPGRVATTGVVRSRIGLSPLQVLRCARAFFLPISSSNSLTLPPDCLSSCAGCQVSVPALRSDVRDSHSTILSSDDIYCVHVWAFRPDDQEIKSGD
jgi:hypothetical protein